MTCIRFPNGILCVNLGYFAEEERAKKLMRQGYRQVQCRKCLRWIFTCDDHDCNDKETK